ncbi:protocadherin gamma-A11-like [Cyprinus carpio]|uniref:Protocadherin gamma-A11-like n=1 Tax=Cyprinus carpio TaxID=7962 RepID=A0A9Q9YJ26_CYPCA|nr:protocadherin gamma-A11-like [Cyprinus carpio]
MASSVMWHQAVFLMVLFRYSVRGQISYSIPEEMPKGSIVGNISQGLGLDLKKLKSGKARIFAGDNTEYPIKIMIWGVLLTKQKIDREALCAKTTPCALHLQLILENPMEWYDVTVEIIDINDNAPSFPKGEITFEISESAISGARFMLENAIDLDVGSNSHLSYSLKPTDNFVLSLQSQADGDRNMEMVLQKPLDRENKEQLSLLLTAVDGGEPQLTSTVQIHITVLDANDNPPLFSQRVYKATLPENTPRDTVITSVSASDADEGSNAIIKYYMSSTGDVNDLFMVDAQSGEITLKGSADFEKASRYQFNIQARDQGGLSDSCKVIIDLTDINDNKPAISIVSMSNSISEQSRPSTVVAMLNVNDLDSGLNGQVHCYINDNIPFVIASSSSFFSLQTEQELDREREAEYNISVICTDEGVPALSSKVSLRVQISDVNDNAPVFEKSHYEACVLENNTPGLSIFKVKASDADWNQNAHVSYILEDSIINGVSVSSYVSVHPESGLITAVRSFDYEQLKDFHFRVKAQDGGSPPLSSNVTVKITIKDQNDNAPQILYGGQNVLVVDPNFTETMQRAIKKTSSIDDLGSAESCLI